MVFFYLALRIWEIWILCSRFIYWVTFHWISCGRNFQTIKKIIKLWLKLIYFFLFICGLKMRPIVIDFLTRHLSFVCVLWRLKYIYMLSIDSWAQKIAEMLFCFKTKLFYQNHEKDITPFLPWDKRRQVINGQPFLMIHSWTADIKWPSKCRSLVWITVWRIGGN